jgi:hypothetical protein
MDPRSADGGVTPDSRPAGTARRTVLKRGIVGLAVLSGATGTATGEGQAGQREGASAGGNVTGSDSGDRDPSREVDESDYGTVYDLVEQGADPDGGESITPVLEDLRGDDTLVRFPAGRFYMDREFRFTGFRNFGLVGTDATTIVPADTGSLRGSTTRLFRLGTASEPGRDLHLEGVTVDQTAADTGLRVVNGVVSDGMVVKDVEVRGRHDSGLPGPGLFCVTAPGGEGRVDGFTATDGAAAKRNTPNRGDGWWGDVTGVYANGNRGTLRFEDCALGGFPATGLYGAQSDGRILVEGGTYENSETASIRLGGDGSAVRDATVRVESVRDAAGSQRGIRLERGRDLAVRDTTVEITAPNGDAILVRNDVESATVRDCSVAVSGNRPNDGIWVAGGAGETTISGTNVTLDVPGGYGIRLTRGNGTDHPRVLCRDVTVEGQAGGEGGRFGILNARDNAEFRDDRVHHASDAPSRSALRNTGDDCLVYGGTYRSRRVPIVDYGARTWVEEIYAAADGDFAAYRLMDESRAVLIKESTLVGGIDERGSAGLRTWSNDDG